MEAVKLRNSTLWTYGLEAEMLLVLNIVPLYMYLGNLPLEGEIGAFLFPFFFNGENSAEQC